MIKQRQIFHFAQSQIAYTLFSKEPRVIENKADNQPLRRIMLLHGAGVAGELTWTFIANYLTHWDEVLVPDLLGMGQSFFEPSDQLEFSIENICHSLFGLLRHLHWSTFDLVGYSLGGLVALELNAEAGRGLDQNASPDTVINSLCLIEPALFSDHSLQSALNFRQSFVPLAASIKSEPDNDQHFIDFLDLVSPNRKRSSQVDKLAIQRLQLRPLGFAHALAAVSDYADNLDEFKLQQLIASIPRGLGIVGGLSNPGLLLAQQKIQRQLQGDRESYSTKPPRGQYWHIESLANADHSLVYVRPKIVANLINEYLG